MMNAPDSPWRMRPSIRNAEARLPDGANPTSSEPMMLRTKPICTTFTRPNRSARLPMTTMKMPENSAVIDTAMFITLVSIPRSSRHHRRDVQRRLGEQPERQHAEDDAEQDTVISDELRLLTHPRRLRCHGRSLSEGQQARRRTGDRHRSGRVRGRGIRGERVLHAGPAPPDEVVVTVPRPLAAGCAERRGVAAAGRASNGVDPRTRGKHRAQGPDRRGARESRPGARRGRCRQRRPGSGRAAPLGPAGRPRVTRARAAVPGRVPSAPRRRRCCLTRAV